MIVEDPPLETKQGGIIKGGVNRELDQLRQQVGGGKEFLAQLEARERQRTGITSLKVRFNKVFGFYIEVSKANLHLVPADYIRKQTLVNAERFITAELKEYEEVVLTAEERIHQLEYEIFNQVVNQIVNTLAPIQQASQNIATLDCLASFAEQAVQEKYIRPQLTTAYKIQIKAGRHPVVEKYLQDYQFVPNDVKLDNKEHQLLIITGPNMAGKSVFIRQVALIVLLAQIGSFVPAEQATIGLVDRIFVRSGATDAVAAGLSTFMMEMVETAHILHNSTNKSLVILDEIGRGTSTYDGISIAWAVAEYLVQNPHRSPKTLFATHYHELQALADCYPGIKNYQVAVQEKNGEPIFLHKVVPGGASHSYGIAVAKMAGVPQEVIQRARSILADLEKRQLQTKATAQSVSAQQITFLREQEHPVLQKLQALNINKLTPLEALNQLAELKKLIT